MEIKFVDPTVRALVPVARVHSTGRLGFNSDAAKYMNLNDSMSFVIGVPESEKKQMMFFLIDSRISDHFKVPPSLEVTRSGQYYSLKFKNLLNQLEIDFQDEKLEFTIEKTEFKGFDMFVLTQRLHQIESIEDTKA